MSREAFQALETKIKGLEADKARLMAALDEAVKEKKAAEEKLIHALRLLRERMIEALTVTIDAITR